MYLFGIHLSFKAALAHSCCFVGRYLVVKVKWHWVIFLWTQVTIGRLSNVSTSCDLVSQLSPSCLLLSFLWSEDLDSDVLLWWEQMWSRKKQMRINNWNSHNQSMMKQERNAVIFYRYRFSIGTNCIWVSDAVHRDELLKKNWLPLGADCQ